MTSPAHQILRDVFGYDEFRGQRQTAIERAMAGQERQMVSDRPTDSVALLEISGVGQAKLTRYGEEFLEVIRRGG